MADGLHSERRSCLVWVLNNLSAVLKSLKIWAPEDLFFFFLTYLTAKPDLNWAKATKIFTYLLMRALWFQSRNYPRAWSSGLLWTHLKCFIINPLCTMMASPTQWTWVWASSRRQCRTGKPGVLQSMGLQSQTQLSNWITKLSSLAIVQILNFDTVIAYRFQAMDCNSIIKSPSLETY